MVAAAASSPHRVVSIINDPVSIFELAVSCEVFGIHRPEVPGWPYVHQVVSEHSGPIPADNGLTVTASSGLDAVADADTVVVPAWSSRPQHAGHGIAPAVVDALSEAHGRGARIATLCTGAFALAATGLLDGRRATTHWMHAEELTRRHPAVLVDPGVLYVDEDPLFTSAGTAAGIDLLLHLVRLDLGAHAANTVARRMVVPPHRDGGQAQFVQTPVPACAADDPLGDVLAWMLDHLAEPVSVEDLARRAGQSPRTFARRFVEVTGTTPLQWILFQRVARARVLLETTDLPVEHVASSTGFSTAAGLRTHFQRVVGSSPGAYRRTFRGAPVAV